MILAEPKKEVVRIIQAAERIGLRLRVLGGLAVSLTSPSASTHPKLKRFYADIDLMGLRKDERQISRLLTELGYEPNQRFNALHGQSRMIFNNPLDDSHIDIFLDNFQMCHTLELQNRLLDGYLSLPIADLLLTKLQIIEMNEKDMQDILSILLDHEATDYETVNSLDLKYWSDLLSRDWGFYTTVFDNLNSVGEKLQDYLTNNDGNLVLSRVEKILSTMESSQKSFKWKMRAKIGKRMEWYDLPDEVDR